MCGRAGRPGLDTLGEAILMAPPHVTSEKGYQHLLKLLVVGTLRHILLRRCFDKVVVVLCLNSQALRCTEDPVVMTL